MISIFLVAIAWSDGYGQVGSNPIYGNEVNSLFLDVINDIGFEQYVDLITQNINILDLVFSTYSNILELSIIPEMSDHEAVALTQSSFVP